VEGALVHFRYPIEPNLSKNTSQKEIEFRTKVSRAKVVVQGEAEAVEVVNNVLTIFDLGLHALQEPFDAICLRYFHRLIVPIIRENILFHSTLRN